MTTLKKIGEFGLIDRIKKSVHVNSAVLLGIGDDAAALKAPSRGKVLLFATDMLLENRHFRLREATGFEIGWKAMMVNVSDIAAMGGLPTHAVVAVGLPKKLPLTFVDALNTGLLTAARQFKINLVGGDTNQSDKLIISVALLGEASKGHVVTRAGAKPGDLIFVTGPLGGSYRSKKHLRFLPKIKEAQFLVQNFKISGMMDISDGLGSDLFRLSEASRVGAVLIEKDIPLSRGVKNVYQALNDGEDFELLFTLSPREAERMKAVAKHSGLASFYEIGRVTAERNIYLKNTKGVLRRLSEKGYHHFT